MKTSIVALMGLLAMTALPLSAEAQGIVGGAQHGAAQGERAAGPVGGVIGGVVGGAVGGVVGGARGVLGLPRHRYHHGYRSYRRSLHHRRHG